MVSPRKNISSNVHAAQDGQSAAQFEVWQRQVPKHHPSLLVLEFFRSARGAVEQCWSMKGTTTNKRQQWCTCFAYIVFPIPDLKTPLPLALLDFACVFQPPIVPAV